MRTAFRMMALWDYSSTESSRRQFLKEIERANTRPGPFLVNHAVHRRLLEIRWLSLYGPLLFLAVPVLTSITVGVALHNFQYLYLSLGILLSLALVYRVTWYSQYLDASRAIHSAGDMLRDQAFRKPSFKLPETIKTIGYKPASVDIQQPSANNNTTQIVETSLVEAVLAAEPPISEEPESRHKGVIPTILLHELVQEHCAAHRADLNAIDAHVVEYRSIDKLISKLRRETAPRRWAANTWLTVKPFGRNSPI